MNIKFGSLIIFLFAFTMLGFAQPEQENSIELERRHGFKGIKLNQSIDSVLGASLKKEFSDQWKEEDAFPAKLYSVKHNAYASIGEVKVNNIEIKTYRDLVYEIEVTTDKDNRVMKAMEMAFGKALYNLRSKNYRWRADNLSLTFIGNKNSITLIYKSYEVIKLIGLDQGKKIERIAEDF